MPRESNPKPKSQKSKYQPKLSRGPFGLSVVEAGALIGLGRNAAYEAVKAGQIPSLQFGSRLIVPRMPWLKKIGADDAA